MIMYPLPFIDFLAHFHGDRDYFECHEILEEFWKSQPAPEPIWEGLIQIAVGLYHHRRNNFAGAQKMINGSISILRQNKEQVTALGLDAEKLLNLLETRLSAIQANQTYQSINLPITDVGLLQLCQKRCAEMGKEFGEASDCSNLFLIDKHKLRDRSSIIAERNRRLEEKRRRKTE